MTISFRFPWESAFTGTEVTNPCCPEVAEFEIHISADILFAIQLQYVLNKSRQWLCSEAYQTVVDIADYFVSRVKWSESEGKYNIESKQYVV